MTTLNEAYKMVQDLNLPKAPNNEHDLLGIQESITRLWISSWKKDQNEIGKRLANLLIGTLINAKNLGIHDIEYHFNKRMEEFKKEIDSGSCWEKITAAIIENSEGDILLYLRDNKPNIPFPHHWDLFGGHVEEGETTEEALIREIKEELDYDVKEYKFFKKYNCTEGDAYPNIKFVYIVKIDKPIEDLKLQEGEKLRFFSKEEIPNVKFANILKSIVMDYIDSK